MFSTCEATTLAVFGKHASLHFHELWPPKQVVKNLIVVGLAFSKLEGSAPLIVAGAGPKLLALLEVMRECCWPWLSPKGAHEKRNAGIMGYGFEGGVERPIPSEGKVEAKFVAV